MSAEKPLGAANGEKPPVLDDLVVPYLESEPEMVSAGKWLLDLAKACDTSAARNPETPGSKLEKRKSKIIKRVVRLSNKTALLSLEQFKGVGREIDRLLECAYREKYAEEDAGIVALATLINTFK